MLNPEKNSSLKLNFCTLYLNNHYIINEVNDGVFLEWTMLNEFNDLLIKHFNKNPFVFISNRINSYSLDPNLYKKANEILNIVGFAIVSDNQRVLDNSNVESLFINSDFETFKNVTDAISWSKTIIAKYL